MSAQLRELSAILEAQLGGGAPYFDKLDQILRAPGWYRALAMRYLEEYPTTRPRIALSGGFGRGFAAWLKAGEWGRYMGKPMVFPGGLRDGHLKEVGRDLTDQEFVFLDDSLYKGRTHNEIRRVIEGAGGWVSGALVLYDGSREPLTAVKSLFRYHDLPHPIPYPRCVEAGCPKHPWVP